MCWIILGIRGGWFFEEVEGWDGDFGGAGESACDEVVFAMG